jgi:hypothetical protein
MAGANDHVTELERQRTAIEAEFRDGLVPVSNGRPRVLSAPEYRHAQRAIAESFPTSLDPAVIAAVRAGARPGDPLPPPGRMPLIAGVGADAEVIITGDGAGQRVAVLFSHQSFPGVRFGYRYPAPSSRTARYASVWLKEEVETGALNRMMREPPPADDAGIVWTTW